MKKQQRIEKRMTSKKEKREIILAATLIISLEKIKPDKVLRLLPKFDARFIQSTKNNPSTQTTRSFLTWSVCLPSVSSYWLFYGRLFVAIFNNSFIQPPHSTIQESIQLFNPNSTIQPQFNYSTPIQLFNPNLTIQPQFNSLIPIQSFNPAFNHSIPHSDPMVAGLSNLAQLHEKRPKTSVMLTWK